MMLNKLFKSSRSKALEDPSKNLHCKEFEVNNWIISDFVINKLVPVVGFHPFPLNELMLMTATVCRFKPEFIFEWGTNIGKSARIFYEISNTFNVHTEIHSIDLPDDVFHNEHPKNDRGIMVRNINQVKLHQADGLQFSLDYVKQHAKNKRVLFFVDGDHSYESVKKELDTILKNIDNPIVLLHDTFFQSEESGYNVGPITAINEVLNSYKHQYSLISTNMGLPGMSLVFRT